MTSAPNKTGIILPTHEKTADLRPLWRHLVETVGIEPGTSWILG
jgi:hypothetical protein